MDINFLILIISQLGTWITIILVYFTLREMRNQRKASQKPDLVIPKATIYGYDYGREGKPMLIPRFWSDDKDVKDDEGRIWKDAPIKLYNVGFGVAKDIELKWTVDYYTTLQQIKDYCYQHSIRIILTFEGDGVYVDSDVLVSLSPQTFRHDFLLPASITSEGIVSHIPPAVKELISILIYLRNHYNNRHRNPSSPFEMEVPLMDLELHYNDMENSHYTKSFEVMFSTPSYTMFSDESSIRGLKQLFIGEFEFKPTTPPSILEQQLAKQIAETIRNTKSQA